ncbi:hypothetical protein D3C87_2070280 [compost metagenome]
MTSKAFHRFLLQVLALSSSDDTQYNCYDGNYNQCMDNATGIKSAKKTNCPDDDQNNCDSIK